MQQKIMKTLEQYKDLLKEFCSSEEEQRHLIEETEIECAISKNTKYSQLFHNMLQCYHLYEIVPKELILDWAANAERSLREDRKQDGEEEEEEDEVLLEVGVEMRTKFLEKMQNYLKQLKEDDSDSDSDDDGGSSSSENSSSDSSSDDSDKPAVKKKAAQSSSSSDDNSSNSN